MSIVKWLLISLFCLALQPPATQWKVENKEIQKGKIFVTELVFSQGKKKRIYRPQKAPFGVIKIKENQIQKTKYFVTSWFHSGPSVVFRVFDPDVKNEPLCEFISYGESARLRVHKKHLQIEIITAQTPTQVSQNLWKNCRKL